jgi:hypothetical protein
MSDHEDLRRDPLLATRVGKRDSTMGDRIRDLGCLHDASEEDHPRL